MIPYGPWNPDKGVLNAPVVLEAVNCLPATVGHQPMPSASAASTNALTGDCIGAVAVYDDDGDVSLFAGDATKLYKIDATSTWQDVSRTSGGAYGAGSGERWQFGNAGALVIAVNITDAPQKYLIGTSTNFTALGGTPPKARYIATVREFVVLGGLDGDERTVHWSGLANPEHWTPGTQSCDFQTFQAGGPVRGLVGGETGYVFQADRVQRMVFVPGSAAIFEFDEIEGGRGLAAPHSLVKVGREAYYLSSDGFYKLDTAGASSSPIGVGKWAEWFGDDLKPGTESLVVGGIDPSRRLVLWAYSSRDNSAQTLDRVLLYNWALDEAATANLSVSAFAQFLTIGVTLDTMDSFGTMDALLFSLDSPVWRGGAALLGVFLADRKLSYLSGAPMSAKIVTADGQQQGRRLIRALRPLCDTRSLSVEVAMREAQGDTVVFGPAERMEDTGEVPAWQSGNVARARLTIDAGASWSQMTGFVPSFGRTGKR